MQPSSPQKTVIITGGNSGLGYACARTIARDSDDWYIVLACRNLATARQAAEQLIKETHHHFIEPVLLDLASLNSVRAFAKNLSTSDFPPLHSLVCNAGLQMFDETHYTTDGFEMTFAVNHLGHFLLVNLLLSSFVSPARIVFVSSDTHDPSQKTGMPPPEYQSPTLLAYPQRRPLEAKARMGLICYTTSKLCNLLCTYELVRRLSEIRNQGTMPSLTVNAFNPGLMPGTGLGRHYPPPLAFLFTHILPSLIPLLRFLGFSATTASISGQHLARLILDPTLEGVTGRYFSGLIEVPSSRESYEQQKGRELWEHSVALVRLQSTETLLSFISSE